MRPNLLIGRRRGPVAASAPPPGGAVALTTFSGTSSSMKAGLTITASGGPVALAGKAASSSSAKASTFQLGLWGANLPTLHEPNVVATFYVDAINGNDSNNGTSVGTAWQTLQHAADYLKNTHTWAASGDIRVYIREGTYQAGTGNEATLRLAFDTASRQPNANRWVIWERYPGDDRPSIRFPTGTSPSNSKECIWATTAGGFVGSFQVFNGLEITGLSTRTNATADSVGMYLDRVSNCQVIDCEIHGIYAADTTGNLTSKAQGIFIDSSTPGSDGINNYIYGCKLYDIGTTTGSMVQLEHSIYTEGHFTTIVNNLIYDIWNGFGIQIFMSGANTINNCIVAHNTVDATIFKSCLVMEGQCSNMVVKNNIFRNATSYGIEWSPSTFTGTNNVMSHNILFSNAVTKSHASPSGWTITEELTSDPLHVNRAARDYGLQSGSPAIGHADPAYSPSADLTGASRGTDPDAGCIEGTTTGGGGGGGGATWGANLPTLHTPNVGLTFYVDGLNGSNSNNGTTVGSAWATLQKAADELRFNVTWPTDQDIRVYIRNTNGTTTYQAGTSVGVTLNIFFDQSGKQPHANRYVIWEGYPGDAKPIIKPPLGSSPSSKTAIQCTTIGTGATNQQGSFQIFKGLDITSNDAAVTNTNDVVGIYIDRGNDCEIIDCHIHNLKGHASSGVAKCQGVFVGASDNFTTFGKNCYIYRCLIHDIGGSAGAINIQEHGIYFDAYGARVVNNVFYNMVNGFGIQMYNSNAELTGFIIVHNTVDGTIEKSCMTVPDKSINAVIKNNIFRGASEYGVELYPGNAFTGSGNLMTHNIIFSNSAGLYGGSPGALTPPFSGWTVNNQLTSNPLHTNPGTRDYSLQASSPAIGHADPNYSPTHDFLGNARDPDTDCGAIERV